MREPRPFRDGVVPTQVLILVTDKPEPELDEDGNELPVKVVELTDEELAARCIVLNKSITLTTFNYLRRGLFEKDKLTVATLVTTRILVDNDLLPGEDVSYLFLGKVHPDPGISRRPAVLRRLHAVDARRLHLGRGCRG